MGFQANTVALFYRKVRQLIIENLPDIAPEQGDFEADESYFGGVRKGKRGRGAAGKELAKHQAQTKKMAEKLAQEHSLFKTAATHCAKNILRYKEAHGENPSKERGCTAFH